MKYCKTVRRVHQLKEIQKRICNKQNCVGSISNYIPRKTVWCDYLPVPLEMFGTRKSSTVPASDGMPTATMVIPRISDIFVF